MQSSIYLHVEDCTLQKNPKSCPFYNEIKTNTLIRNLRQVSFHKNVFYKYTQSGVCTSYIKRGINIQKNKSEKHNFKIRHSRELNHLVTCYISLD